MINIRIVYLLSRNMLVEWSLKCKKRLDYWLLHMPGIASLVEF